MTENDLPMLHDWLNRPHVVEWRGGEDKRPAPNNGRPRSASKANGAAPDITGWSR